MNPFRRPLIAGNWKMNSGGRDACTLAHDVAVATKAHQRVDVVIAPPFTALAAVAHEIQEARGTIETPDGVGVHFARIAMSNDATVATLAASLAFMLPIATPPNAMMYATGKVSLRQMLHAGWWLDVMSLVLVTGLCRWVGGWVVGG